MNTKLKHVSDKLTPSQLDEASSAILNYTVKSYNNSGGEAFADGIVWAINHITNITN